MKPNNGGIMWSSFKKLMNDKERSNEVSIYFWCVTIVIILLLWVFQVVDNNVLITFSGISIIIIINNFKQIKKKQKNK
jgi:hypothetical protein